MKAKSIILAVLGVALGLFCDWALIHNFFWATPSSTYYQRYIWFYEALSWFNFAGLALAAIHLALYKNLPQHRGGKYDESTKKTIDTLKPRLWKTIYRAVNTYPMILFAGIFVCDISLTVVWILCLIMGHIAESYAKDVSKIIEETEALEASMKASQPEA